MQKFKAKNKIIICLFILLFSFIIIAYYNNFINNQRDVVSYDDEVSTLSTNLPEKVQLTLRYHLPNYIYNSKDELFKDFFSYFYNYIITYHASKGIPHLKSLGINTVEDALTLCRAWNENDATGLPLVGKAFSPYFLKNKAGSNFKYQQDKDFFVGYCLNQNRFIDFLYFLKTFFYHFRIDEGYTIIHSDGSITNEEGSDFFASSYASIIDTAKFFYYSKDTLPYYFHSLKHIPELYDKIPGVLKTPFDREKVLIYDTTLDDGIYLPDSFDCYGYKFVAWNTSENLSEDFIDKIDNSIISKHSSKNSDNIVIDLYGQFDSVGDFIEEYLNDFSNK